MLPASPGCSLIRPTCATLTPAMEAGVSAKAMAASQVSLFQRTVPDEGCTAKELHLKGTIHWKGGQ